MTTGAPAMNESSTSPNEIIFSPQGFSITSVMLIIFICLGLLALLIVLANSLVFYLVLVQPKLRTKTNYFLISLAASDLFSGLLGVPLLISCNVVHSHEELCLGMDICQRFLAISSILHLSGAVMERYLKIARPFRHHGIVTKARLTAVIVCVWSSSLTTALVQMAWDEAENRQTIDVVYSGTVLVVCVLVPYVFSLTAFVLMYVVIKRGEASRKRMARRPSNRGRPSKRKVLQQKRVLLVYFAMVTCFTVGWFPYFLVTLFADLGHELAMHLPFWLDVTLLFLKYSTSLANPLLFTFFKTDFQKALKNAPACISGQPQHE